MKYLKFGALMLCIMFVSVGCSENHGEKEIESFLNVYYNVQYKESLKLFDEMYAIIDRELAGKEEENIVSIDSPKFGEIYPKTFAPYFTEKEFETALNNGVFKFLPQIAVGKKADYEIESVKQLSSIEKDGYWEFLYEVDLKETIGNKVTAYTDKVRFYSTEENGKWEISYFRILDPKYAK